ncbi:AbrB family transcriptional regulator [Psychromarinibacter halotolerans]|uniref:AbrB family transcriptional regulator n=1 Tax=Psychromarinibacter halotolerans TaxID=1775175 RepID=A0ABV7GZC7_9RHOB|nr:AbrB family transcriptional regulator [Psychromarinibacter halotolerans]MDF0596292.1 AbrB family transcriptional regulator [Psychromarinibacter halotolerans]
MIRLILILCFGGVLGAGANVLGLPLPWLVSPLVGTAILSLSGVRVKTPPQLRKIGQLVAAVAIGTTFTPEVVEGLASYVGIIFVCAAASIAAGILSASIVARSGVGFDTAYFASMPGGVAEMSIMAERYGGDTALVAVAQSMRIILVVLTLPVLLVLLSGDAGARTPLPQTMPLSWLGLFGMLVGAVLLGWLLDRLKVMNAYFLAGLAMGGFAILGPVRISSVPSEFVNVAQVMIGVALGSRVEPKILLQMRKFLPATVGGTVFLILFNVVLSWGVAVATGLDFQTLALATSPGGVAEMSITATALHLLAPMVTAFHLVRILIIVLMSAPLYRACRKLVR